MKKNKKCLYCGEKKRKKHSYYCGLNCEDLESERRKRESVDSAVKIK